MDPNAAWHDFLWDLAKCEVLIERRKDDMSSEDLEQLDCELSGHHADALESLHGLESWGIKGGFPADFAKILEDSDLDATSPQEALDRFASVSDIVGMLEGIL